MKLRMIWGLLICVLLASMTFISARADVIFEPRDDFYHERSEDCVYVGRSFTASGAGGTVDVLKEPDSSEIVASINNGNEFYVSFTYTDTDGAEWGVVEFKPDGSGNLEEIDYIKDKPLTGWIRMPDLKLVYDFISFAEDNGNEFQPFTGDYADFENKPLVFWSYPGSGKVVRTDDSPVIDEYFKIWKTYTDDDNNREWGFIEVYMDSTHTGIKNVWVCISDPTGAGIERVVAPVPSISETPVTDTSAATATQSGQLSQLPGATVPTVQKDQTPMLLLIALIVAAVVIVTGVIIAVFWKKNSKKDGAVK